MRSDRSGNEVFVPDIEQDQRGTNFGAGSLMELNLDENNVTESQCHRLGVRIRCSLLNKKLQTAGGPPSAMSRHDLTIAT